MTITRNFEATATMTAHGLIEGNSYQVHKMQVQEVAGFGVRSTAWVYLDNGSALEVPNAHIVLAVDA
jgi:hypothetical protein